MLAMVGAKPVVKAQPAPVVKPIAEWNLDGARFNEELKAAIGPPFSSFNFARDESRALVLSNQSLTLANPHTRFQSLLPRRHFSLAVWAAVDQPLEWGGLFGAIHDNGDDEKGWLLGYRNNRWSFALASEGAKKLTYLEGKTPFEKGRFYHVGATYDGQTMRLYVNGALDAQSNEQSGPVLQAEATPLVLGAYTDSNESYPMTGRLHSGAIYHEALSPGQMRAVFEKEKRLAQLPPAIQPILPTPATPPANGWKPQLSEFAVTPQLKARLKTRNVIFISTDGLRWQEVFRGAQQDFIGNDAAIKTAFWRDNLEERRAALMPFFWNTIARQGQIWGNRDKGSEAGVTNGKNFSYPGYSEFLVGYADDRINSNNPTPNPNLNVLEWLHGKPQFKNKVMAANNWAVLPAILNRERNNLPMWTYHEKAPATLSTPRLQLIEELIQQTPSPWGSCHFDSFTFQAAKELLITQKPRAFYVNFAETDEWAHAFKYGEYLKAARRVDDFIQQFWTLTQSLPEYRGTTTFIITTDHGRGLTAKDWGNHSANTPNSGEIWLAILGPDTPALGERMNTTPVAQGQVAATIAALLGEDWRATNPQALPAVKEAF